MAKMTATSGQRMRIRQALVEETLAEVLEDKDFHSTKSKPFPQTNNWRGAIAERMRELLLDEALHHADYKVGAEIQKYGEANEWQAWGELCRRMLKEEPGMALPEDSKIVTARALDEDGLRRREEAIAEMRRRQVQA
jgi:hypothetical protein